MSMVFLPLLLISDLIQQTALVNFMLFLKTFILNILKENCISLVLWAFISLKLHKDVRRAQCKRPRLVKSLLNFDLNSICKSSGTALLVTKVSYKPLPVSLK